MLDTATSPPHRAGQVWPKLCPYSPGHQGYWAGGVKPLQLPLAPPDNLRGGLEPNSLWTTKPLRIQIPSSEPLRLFAGPPRNVLNQSEPHSCRPKLPEDWGASLWLDCKPLVLPEVLQAL